MQRRFFTALIALTLSAPIGFAQRTFTPPTPAQQVANKVARLTTLLTQITVQQGQATTIFTTEQTALSGLSASMKTARTALQTAVQANDTAGISAAATQIGSLTAQQITATSTADAAFYAILSPTQQTQYKQLGGHGGHGGVGGPAFRPGFRR